jgi:hypothetical protein
MLGEPTGNVAPTVLTPAAPNRGRILERLSGDRRLCKVGGEF